MRRRELLQGAAALGWCAMTGTVLGAAALPAAALRAGRVGSAPTNNAAFFPPVGAMAAADFASVLHIEASTLRTLPGIDKPLQDGRDARLFPGVTL